MPIKRRIRISLAASCLLATCLALHGCGTAYLTQAALGQRDLLSRSVPIDDVLADELAPDELKKKLRLVLEVREFASTELGLPDNDSYRSYADLEREYAVWNVFAAPEFSTEARQWCFPIVGCVAYRGYFAKDKAEAFANKFRKKGFDVYVGGVAAYSTLGHFDDPVLNTMVGWNETALAAVIFHELTHQRLYIKDDSSFSESLATVVEGEGLRRWLIHLGEEERLASWQKRKARQKRFADLVAATRERLTDIYDPAPVSDDEKARARRLKEHEFKRLHTEYEQLKKREPEFASYERWFDRDLNNAHLVSVATYNDLVPQLEALLESVEYDLDAFFAAAEKMAKEPKP